MIRRRLAAIDAALDDTGSMRAVALLRLVLGPVVLLHLAPYLRDTLDGRWYGDHFHAPFWTWYPEPSRGVWTVLLWLGAIAAVLMTVGLVARVATAVAAGVVGFNLFLSETHFHHNRAYLLVLLIGVALARCDRVLALDGWLARRRGHVVDDHAPLWPVWFLRLEVAAVYLASGTGKLVDPDWFGGTVTWLRVMRVRDQLDASILPPSVVDLLASRDFHTVMAKVIVLTELAIGLGFWWRRSRLGALWLAIVFHLAIEVAASVQTFSIAAIAALLVWATPATRDRVLVFDRVHRAARFGAAVVPRLDWLARFSIASAPCDGSAIVLVDRDGTEATGWRAATFAATRLPPTFWPAAPLLLLRPLRRRSVTLATEPSAEPAPVPSRPGPTSAR